MNFTKIKGKIMIKKVTVKGFNTENTYFNIDSKTNHGFLIDPGYEGEKLLEMINKTVRKLLDIYWNIRTNREKEKIKTNIKNGNLLKKG